MVADKRWKPIEYEKKVEWHDGLHAGFVDKKKDNGVKICVLYCWSAMETMPDGRFYV